MTKREAKRIATETVANNMQSLIESEVFSAEGRYTWDEVDKLNEALTELRRELWKRVGLVPREGGEA